MSNSLESVNIACPCCGKDYQWINRSNGPINAETEPFFAWCGYGPCRSKKSNLGAAGRNLEEAVLALDEIIENEMETWA